MPSAPVGSASSQCLITCGPPLWLWSWGSSWCPSSIRVVQPRKRTRRTVANQSWVLLMPCWTSSGKTHRQHRSVSTYRRKQLPYQSVVPEPNVIFLTSWDPQGTNRKSEQATKQYLKKPEDPGDKMFFTFFNPHKNRDNMQTPQKGPWIKRTTFLLWDSANHCTTGQDRGQDILSALLFIWTVWICYKSWDRIKNIVCLNLFCSHTQKRDDFFVD